MYDPHLETFIKVADCGSFLKASDKLYISANAVTKQVNLLENRLGVKLFHRSTQGLVLTDAGELIYTESKKIIRHINSVLQKAKELEQHQEYVIHIGVSLMNPANILLEQWSKASALYPNIRLEVIPYADTVPEFNSVLDKLGSKIDFVSCPYQTTYWGDRYNSFHLQNLPALIACSKNHPLARKEKLSIQDLYGETLLMVEQGLSSCIDSLRDELEVQYPQIHLKSVQYIDVHTFNHIVSSNDLMLSAACWKDVHPLLATISVDWAYTLPYGLIYSKNPSKEILQFIMAIGTVLD